eukprot:2586219-Rhodomonas_salina.2
MASPSSVAERDAQRLPRCGKRNTSIEPDSGIRLGKVLLEFNVGTGTRYPVTLDFQHLPKTYCGKKTPSQDSRWLGIPGTMGSARGGMNSPRHYLPRHVPVPSSSGSTRVPHRVPGYCKISWVCTVPRIALLYDYITPSSCVSRWDTAA